jgi:hypothetical protein
MGILDDAKKAIGLGTAKKVEEPKKQRKKKTAKEIATENGEPWVDVVSVEVDPENPGSGAFELDWNEHFIKKLYKAGYRDENEEDMVDRWFQDVCRNVVMETYEKEMADPNARVERNDLGGGRSEYK